MCCDFVLFIFITIICHTLGLDERNGFPPARENNVFNVFSPVSENKSEYYILNDYFKNVKRINTAKRIWTMKCNDLIVNKRV